MPSSRVAHPPIVTLARHRPAASGTRSVLPAAAAPTALVRALALIAWGAWTVFAVTTGLGGTPQRGLGAVSFVTAIVACAAFCGVHAWQTRLVRRLALTCAVAAYGYTALAYVFAADAAARFPSLYDTGLFAFYLLTLVWLVQFITDQRLSPSNSVWLDAAALSACASAVGSAVLGPALGADPTPGAVGELLYVLGDLTLLAFVAAAWGLTGWRRSRSLSFAAGGAAVLAVGDGLLVATGTQGAPPMVSVVLWPAGLLLLASVSLCKPVVGESVSSLWAKIAVPTTAALASAIVIVITDSDLPEVAAAVALAFVVVRLGGNLLENSRLLATVERSAITDSLTGLANRQLLLDRVSHALARQPRRGGAVAVMFLDLDDFKLINDSLGHLVGDDVLRTVGQRLQEALRGEDTIARPSSPGSTVARLGGDEFVVLLEDLIDTANAAEVADRILDALREPVVVAEHRLDLDASVGIALTWGEQQHEPIDLLRDADTAMYAAKDRGKGSYRFFEEEMHERIVARTDVSRELRSAINDGQLRLLYQPQVDLATGNVTGVEALVRWEHPERGLLTPDLFIPIAEITGMIVAVDDWVLRDACCQLRRWQDRGLDLALAVNVSGRSLLRSGLADRVEATLLATGARAGQLEIEITETVAVADDEQTRTTLQRLRALGVTVAIDDFGMGHSALSRLQTFPVDRLKIDRSFIAPLRNSGAEKGSIPAAMIAMARSLDLHVVAEGVETAEHLEALRSLGCDTAQGYLFSRPIGVEEIEPLMGRSLCPPAAPEHGAPSDQDRLVNSLLAELQRLTGLDSTFLGDIDTKSGVERIVAARNTGALEIPEALTIPWSDTVCRRSLDQGVAYTEDVPSVFGDSPAARDLGLQTYAGVPVRDGSGTVTGMLCGVSTRRISLGPTTLRVMESFADLIAQARRAG